MEILHPILKFAHRTVRTNKSTHVFYDAKDLYSCFLTEGDLSSHISCRHCLQSIHRKKKIFVGIWSASSYWGQQGCFCPGLWLPEVWWPRWLHPPCCASSCSLALPGVRQMFLVVCPPTAHPAPPMQHLTQTGQSKLLSVQKKGNFKENTLCKTTE